MAWWWVALLVIGLLIGCTRSDDSPSVPASTPAVRDAAPGTAATPAPAPTDVDDDEDDDEEPDDDIDAAWSDFEIDADASSYSGYVPKQVAFVAKAMNGTPPFTYVWDFGDGSPTATGESVMHTFTKLGKVDVFVTGTDGEGRTSRVQMVLFLLTPEDYARRHNMDPATLPTIIVAPTPVP